MIPAPEPDMKGKVLDYVQTGYTLNDKVIRHAKVVIAQYIIRFSSFLEVLFSLLVTRILVRVVLNRLFTEAFFISSTEAVFSTPSTS